jgi:PhnB protein
MTPYLHFAGNCEEALDFYAHVFGGKIESLNRFAGSPMEAHVAPEDKQKVMHAAFSAGDLRFMASDSTRNRAAAGGGIALSLFTKSGEEAQRTFGELAIDGTVTMPLQEVFWGGRFGMVVDRFGIEWMLSTP